MKPEGNGREGLDKRRKGANRSKETEANRPGHNIGESGAKCSKEIRAEHFRSACKLQNARNRNKQLQQGEFSVVPTALLRVLSHAGGKKKTGLKVLKRNSKQLERDQRIREAGANIPRGTRAFVKQEQAARIGLGHVRDRGKPFEARGLILWSAERTARKGVQLLRNGRTLFEIKCSN